jgi:hypothetical protein
MKRMVQNYLKLTWNSWTNKSNVATTRFSPELSKKIFLKFCTTKKSSYFSPAFRDHLKRWRQPSEDTTVVHYNADLQNQNKRNLYPSFFIGLQNV